MFLRGMSRIAILFIAAPHKYNSGALVGLVPSVPALDGFPVSSAAASACFALFGLDAGLFDCKRPFFNFAFDKGIASLSCRADRFEALLLCFSFERWIIENSHNFAVEALYHGRGRARGCEHRRPEHRVKIRQAFFSNGRDVWG